MFPSKTEHRTMLNITLNNTGLQQRSKVHIIPFHFNKTLQGKDNNYNDAKVSNYFIPTISRNANSHTHISNNGAHINLPQHIQQVQKITMIPQQEQHERNIKIDGKKTQGSQTGVFQKPVSLVRQVVRSSIMGHQLFANSFNDLENVNLYQVFTQKLHSSSLHSQQQATLTPTKYINDGSIEMVLIERLDNITDWNKDSKPYGKYQGTLGMIRKHVLIQESLSHNVFVQKQEKVLERERRKEESKETFKDVTQVIIGSHDAEELGVEIAKLGTKSH